VQTDQAPTRSRTSRLRAPYQAPQLAPSHIPAEPRPLPSSNAACRASGGARSPPAKPTAARTHSGNEASPPATSASPKLRLSPFLHSQRMALPAKPGRAGPPVSVPLCSAATSPTPKPTSRLSIAKRCITDRRCAAALHPSLGGPPKPALFPPKDIQGERRATALEASPKNLQQAVGTSGLLCTAGKAVPGQSGDAEGGVAPPSAFAETLSEVKTLQVIKASPVTARTKPRRSVPAPPDGPDFAGKEAFPRSGDLSAFPPGIASPCGKGAGRPSTTRAQIAQAPKSSRLFQTRAPRGLAAHRNHNPCGAGAGEAWQGVSGHHRCQLAQASRRSDTARTGVVSARRSSEARSQNRRSHHRAEGSLKTSQHCITLANLLPRQASPEYANRPPRPKGVKWRRPSEELSPDAEALPYAVSSIGLLGSSQCALGQVVFSGQHMLDIKSAGESRDRSPKEP